MKQNGVKPVVTTEVLPKAEVPVAKEIPTKKPITRLNQAMVTAWRLGLGRMMNRFPRQTGRILVLTTVGRKTGMDRRVPLTYAPLGGCVYVVAESAQCDWFQNLEVHPGCEVWLPEGYWEARAVPITDHRERLLRIREVLHNSGFAAERMAHIDPATITDEELREKSMDYRVVRIDLERRLRGATGPDDLVWLWPMIGLGFVAGLSLWKLATRPGHRHD